MSYWILFLLLILGVFFGAHILIYFTLVKFFIIKTLSAKITIIIILAVLFFGIIGAIALARISDNLFTQGFYFLEMTWFGMIPYLIAACGLGWIIYVINKSLNMKIIMAILFGIVILFAIYGIWSAFSPRIKEVAVTLNNLPGQWHGKKMIQLSDVHLGLVYRPVWFEKVVEDVNAQEPDIIVITGDLFDGMDGELDGFIDSLNNFKAKEGIYFVAGNHEEYLGMEESLKIIGQTGIKILDDEVVDVNGLQLVGISYPELQKEIEINKDEPVILLSHTPTNIKKDLDADAQVHGGDYLNPDLDFGMAKELGIDLQLSGHTHAGQYFPFNILASYFFKGFHYGLHQDGDFQIYISSGTGTWGPPLRIFQPAEIVVLTLS